MRDCDSYLPILDELADRYLGILGFQGPRPNFKIVDNLGSDWLGRTTFSTRNTETTIIEIQASVLDDLPTLERIVAHEIVHHWEFLARMDPRDFLLFKIGIKPPSHGPSFQEGAAMINAVKGDGFVTVGSDRTYVVRKSTRPFYLLITSSRYYVSRRDSERSPFGYAWAARIGPRNREKIDRVLSEGGKLVRIADDRFTHGPRIERWGKIAVPEAGSETAIELARLFETESGIVPP
jgi:hypothetical protein